MAKLVKQIDEMPVSWPDHVGWSLWEASRAWQAEFVAALQASGHSWFTEARAGILGHVGLKGTRQAALVERSGTTKQAVQQLLDGLETDGVITRVADADDRRARIVRLTDKGVAAMRDSNRIKNMIDAAYRERIGEERFGMLMAILRDLNQVTRQP